MLNGNTIIILIREQLRQKQAKFLILNFINCNSM